MVSVVWYAKGESHVAALSIVAVLWGVQRAVFTSMQSGFASVYSDEIVSREAVGQSATFRAALAMAIVLGSVVAVLTIITVYLADQFSLRVPIDGLVVMSSLRCPFMAFSLIMTAALRCQRRNINASIITFAEVLSSCVFAWLFVVKGQLGLPGLGGAMLISSVIAAFYSAILLKSNLPISIIGQIKSNPSTGRVVRKSLLFLCGGVIQPIVKIILFASFISFGENIASTAYTCERILAIFFAPMLSFSFAVSPLVGQNIQANKYFRVNKIFIYTTVISCGCAVLSLICTWFYFDIILLLFEHDALSSWSFARLFLLFSAVLYPFQGVFILTLITFFYSGRNSAALGLLVLWAASATAPLGLVEISNTPNTILLQYLLSYLIASVVGWSALCLHFNKNRRSPERRLR